MLQTDLESLLGPGDDSRMVFSQDLGFRLSILVLCSFPSPVPLSEFSYALICHGTSNSIQLLLLPHLPEESI